MISIKRKPADSTKQNAKVDVDPTSGKPANQDLTLKEVDKNVPVVIPFFRRNHVRIGAVVLVAGLVAVGGHFLAKSKGWNVIGVTIGSAIVGIAGGFAVIKYVPPFKA